MSDYFFYTFILFHYTALVIGVLVLFQARAVASWLRALLAATLAIFLIHLYAAFHQDLFGFDFRIFRKAGCAVWAGVDPCSPEHSAEFGLFVNPPTSLPLFAAFALVPPRTSLALWTILNVALSLMLPLLCWSALRSQAHLDGSLEQSESLRRELPLQTALGLAICLIFAEASLKGFLLGQLSVFTAMMLILALLCQGWKRPIWAGVCLFLATVKVATMVPFLLLFLRRGDRWTWVTLAALALGSCLLTGPARELPLRLATTAGRIAELSAPGNVNDYSFAGTRNESIISFEHLFYRLGMRDRDLIRLAQTLVLLALAGWVAYEVVAAGVPRPDAACLICFLAVLFVYHRDYDVVILTLPLVHCTGRVPAAAGLARWLYGACGLIVIAVLYLSAAHLKTLTQWSMSHGTWGRLVQAAMLPCCTWLVLIAMVLTVCAARGALTPQGLSQSSSNDGTIQHASTEC
jgi:hypothetical protein